MFRQSVQRLAVRSQSTVAKAAPKPLSVAYVGKLESRWEGLAKEDQTQIIDDLKTRMELPWQELTPAEKKAAYYISFGEWGPRKPLYGPGDRARVVYGVLGGIGLALVLFGTARALAKPGPTTLNKQWQEKSDEYLKSKNANPFTGYSQVQ